jgi:hypothetical protein
MKRLKLLRRETYRERDNARESEAGRIIVWEINNIVLVAKEMEMPHELTLKLVRSKASNS